MSRNWAKVEIPPDDILDGARTLDRRRMVWTMDLVPTWVRAEDYLSWAKTALGMGSPFGYDAAVGYAKRAVCRLIDSLVLYNHLHLGRGAPVNYRSKIDALREVGIEVKSVVYDLVIDRRNDIEHSYSGATEGQARHAVELAEMALPPLMGEARLWAIITLGLNYGNIMAPNPAAEGGYSEWSYDWEADVPFLLVDHADPTPRVLIIHRKDEEIRYAPLARFERDQAVELAKQLREQREGGGMQMGCSGPYFIEQMKSHLELDC
jgi:hypothetical protein